MISGQTRVYPRATSIIFRKTNEAFGGLSNMANGFPVCVNGFQIRTCEALYQACRFPHRPDVQRRIIDERSPMTAKMRSKAFRKESRSDWDAVRVKIMNWCLRVKLAQNWNAFSALLLKTGNRPIVEQSRKDDFWGTKPIDEHTLVGMNVLGQLLMELRELVKAEDRASLLHVQPLAIPYFMLGGSPIEIVTAKYDEPEASVVQTAAKPPHSEVDRLAVLQPSLFDVGVAKETTPLVQPVVSKMGVNSAILKLYPAMKASAVEWLGEVPSHWEVYKLRRILTKSTERNRLDLPLLSVVRERGVILRDVTDMDENHNFIPDDLTNYKVVHEGQFAMNKMKAWQGSYGVSRKEGIVSPAYFIFDIDGVKENYFHLAVRSKAYVPFFTQASDGVRIGQWDLSQARMREIPFLVPPASEQTAIVRFLDYADQRIRRYIRAKRKLIALLQEQKQAIIHQAVSGQIDVRTGQPYPAYISSRVEQLGQVPEHWKIRRLKHSAALNPSKTESRESLKPDTAVTFLPMERVGADGRIDPQEVLPASKVWNGFTYFRRDDVLVAKITPCFENGKGAHLHSLPTAIGFGSTEFHVVRARSFMLPQFLYRLTTDFAFRRLGTDAMTGAAGQQRVPSSFIANYPCPIPSLPEQTAIVAYLDKVNSDISDAVFRARRQIDFLREYRTRLIADVVTGKLDVREAAAALPEVDPLAADDELDEPIDADAEENNDGLEAVPEGGDA